MKFRLLFKTPDVAEFAAESAKQQAEAEGKSEEEQEEIAEEILEASRKWVRNSEYLKVEIDTEADTATVLEV